MKKKVLLGSVLLSGAAIASQEVQAEETATSEVSQKVATEAAASSTVAVSSSRQTIAQATVTETEKNTSVKETVVVPSENKNSVSTANKNISVTPEETKNESSTAASSMEKQTVSQSSENKEQTVESTGSLSEMEQSQEKEHEHTSSAKEEETQATIEKEDENLKEENADKETSKDNKNDSEVAISEEKDKSEKEDMTEETSDDSKADTEETEKETTEEVDSEKEETTEEKETSDKSDKESADKESAKEEVAIKEDKKKPSKKTEQSSSKKQTNVVLKENNKKQYQPTNTAKTVKKETVFEKAMRDPESLTEKEINQLTDEEMAELALEGKIYNKQMLENFATRQVYSRAGGQTAAGKAFVKKWGEAARKVANRYGVYASVMMAQAMLESGYGQSELASKHHNLFGIKAGPGYKGKKVLYWTQEFINGKWYTVQDYFRHYDDLESSFIDNAKVIRYGTDWDSSYYKGAWKENCKSYRDAAQWLQGRYATDPTYANKLISIIQTYNLTQFDTPQAASKPSTSKPTNKPSSNGIIYHTVKRGETLSKIANQYKTTVKKIASDNKIKNVNHISVGQKLKIVKTASQSTSKPAQKPVSKPSQKPTSSSKTYTYKVKQGDTLGKIATKYKTSVNSIAKENKIKNVNHIYVGQTLKITKKTSSQSKPTTSKPTYQTVTKTKTYTYTVKRGDTLSKIATKYKTTVKKVASDNKIKNVNRISVGQKLKIKTTVTEKVKVTTPKKSAPKKTVSSKPATYRYVKSTKTYTYTVKRGDTLGKVAAKYKTTVKKVASDNKIKNVNRISVGQKLKIKKTVTEKVKVTTPKKSTPKKVSAYTVKRGDTLYSIARRYKVSVSTLVKKNGLKNANQLVVGQKIKIN